MHSATDQLRSDVVHLASIDRPSASDGERRAAEWIAGRLRETGLDPKVEHERVHPTFWWPIGLLNAAAVAAAALPSRRLRQAVSLLGAVALADDIDHRRRIVRGLLPKRSTWNVWAEHGDPGARATVVVVAHHDAAHGGAIYDTRAIEAFAHRCPKLFARVKRWPPVMWAVVVAPLLVAAGRRSLGAVWGVGTIGAMLDIGRSKVVPGANDNAAAVAALIQLAQRRYEDVRVILLSTGSEESNADGMREWVARHIGEFPRENTAFVALETLGSGNLAIPEGEGFLVTHAFDPSLKERAERCAHELAIPVQLGLTNAFISDATPAMRAGYSTILIGAIDACKLPANYHKPSDTADRVDYDCVDRAVTLLDALIRDIASSASKPA